ncbi:MAG: DUF2163 domain-containing protein [Pseudomonadota bacterium]
MRDLPADFAAAIATGVTSICRCWQVHRADGVVLGFTDHDRAIAFDGVVHEARAGMSAGALDSSTGLSIDTQSVEGALSSTAIGEDDIARGLYDSAEVRLYLVFWEAPETRLLSSVGTIGELRRVGDAFEAEIVGRSEALNRPFGRAFLATCDRRLGDGGCGVDLADPAYSAIGTVATLQSTSAFEAEGLAAFETGFFDDGRLVWETGANAGAEARVRRHAAFESAVQIETWLSAPLELVVGDSFRVEAGCDKRMATCRDRFANLANFRGFPHIPGDDWAAGYPDDGGSHDGGSLFRS